MLQLRAQFDASPPAPSAADRVTQAQELLAAGRAAEALAAAEQALAASPGLKTAEAARVQAVQTLQAADPRLTALELTAILRPEEPNAQIELAHAYAELDRPADAERYFKRALAVAPRLAAAHAGLGALYLSVGIEDGAAHHSRLALRSEPGHAVASQTLAEILERRGEAKAAAALLDDAYARQSLFLEPAAASRMTVLVLSTRSEGNIPHRFLLPADRYTRLIWYMEHAREEQFGALPPYDVVFNAIGDADLAAPSAAAVQRFIERCDKPVLNLPPAVARTARGLASMTLGDLEDVVIPRAARIPRGRLERQGLRRAVAEAGFEPPLLVRPTGSHGGKGLRRALSWPELEAAAAALSDQDIYVTAYRDYRSRDGLYRKGRMIFVDRRPYPYHWAGSDHWMVHYDASGSGEDPQRRAEEMRFLEDPSGFLGPRAWAAVRRIGERLDLDFCGLDFGVLPDGRVLVFEANATMLVHPEDPAGPLAAKNPAVARILEAFRARLETLAGS